MPPDLQGLLKSLVAIPSVNPMGRTDINRILLYEDRIVHFIEKILKCRKLKYRRTRVAPHRSNIVATYQPASPKKHLLFESHLDTVPVDGMSIDPFAANIMDGRLYGRGACDVKAGAAAMLSAFLRICEEGTCKNQITLALTADEEHTFLGVEALAKEISAIDFAVVAEPTDLNIVVAHKGVARWTTTVRGKACHSSKPHEGVSAVYRMAKVVSAIEEYARTLHGKSISVGMIQGGVSANTVPDYCMIEVDRRLIPGESAESALEEFEAMLAALHFDFEIENRIAFNCPPLAPMPANHPILKQLIGAIGDPKLESVAYGTDASVLAAAGIACVVFGPGSIAQAHTHDEWVEIAQVETAAEILYRFATTVE